MKYSTLGQLNDKVDVYSFGILLLEIINGKKNFDFALSTNKNYFLEWVCANCFFLCAHLLNVYGIMVHITN